MAGKASKNGSSKYRRIGQSLSRLCCAQHTSHSDYCSCDHVSCGNYERSCLQRFVKRTVWATALPKLSALRLDLETIRKSTRVMDLLQQSLPCFRFYLSGTCTHCGRAPKKKLQSTWSIRPRLLTHVHEQTTLSRYRWYRRNLELTCPVVHFALEVQDMPKSDAEIFHVKIRYVCELREMGKLRHQGQALKHWCHCIILVKPYGTTAYAECVPNTWPSGLFGLFDCPFFASFLAMFLCKSASLSEMNEAKKWRL